MLFGPLTVAANLVAQQIPFNAIFLISDPMQKWRLLGNFLLYMLPFLAGAVFLGTVFLKAQKIFGRVYFADLTGSGIGGLVFLGAMFLINPDNLIVVPLLLWFVGTVLWFEAVDHRRGSFWLVACAALAVSPPFSLPGPLDLREVAVSRYKGVAPAPPILDRPPSYARA